MNLEQIKNNIKKCLEKLYGVDLDLFNRNKDKGLCERCMVFRFAHYLQNVFCDYFVDCDFNSSVVNGQRMSGKPITGSNGGKTKKRFIDIIIHKRMAENNSDFICFEIKKWNNCNQKVKGVKSSAKDKNNLCVLTKEYGYKYGFYLIFGKTKPETRWTIFQNGRPLNGEELVFDN